MGNRSSITDKNALPALSLKQFVKHIGSYDGWRVASFYQWHRATMAIQETLLSQQQDRDLLHESTSTKISTNISVYETLTHLYCTYCKLRDAMGLGDSTRIYVAHLIRFVNKNWHNSELWDGAFLTESTLASMGDAIIAGVRHAVDNALTDSANNRALFCYAITHDYLDEERLSLVKRRLLREEVPKPLPPLLPLTNSGVIDYSCCVCLDQPSSVLYLPCHHMKVCNSCNRRILTNCPFCRAFIAMRINVFR